METEQPQYVNTKCGRCGKRANMEVLTSYTDVEVHEDDEEWEFDETWWTWRLSRCARCEAINLILEDQVGEMRGLYPQLEKRVEGLPPEVAQAHEAAKRVKTVDFNAYAVLLGRVLDKVCENRKAQGESLPARLQDL